MAQLTFNLKSWLNTLKLSEYLHRFIDAGFNDEEKFMNLTESDLRKMGVKSAHINIIGKAIAKRRAMKGETEYKILEGTQDIEREEWSCDQCTFINKPRAQECEMCQAKRPTVAVADQAELLESLMEILNLPNEIVNIICDYTLPRASRLHEDDFPTQRKLEAMVEWLKKGGAVFTETLHVKSDPSDLYSGISGFAKKNLGPGTVVLEVPLQYLITEETAKNSEIGQKILKSGCRLYSDHSWIAAFLLYERADEKSFWKPYIDCLPQRLHHVPIFFTKEEKQWLKGSFTLRMLEPRIRSLEMEYENIVKHVPEFAKFTSQEFMWARVIVITRCIGLSIGHNHLQALAGIGDALGHKGLDSSTEWDFNSSRQAFVIQVGKKITKGDPVYISFGRKCNSRFFVNYGMALPFNQDNQVQISLKGYPDPTDPLYAEKKRLVASVQRHGGIWQIAFEHKERITKKCMSFLRICLATEEELKKVQEGSSDLQIILPINVHNEARVIRAVAAACKEAMKEFETTIKEDDELLNFPSSLNHRNSILVRRGEKEVLQAYVDLAAHIDQVEHMTGEQLDNYLNQPALTGADLRTVAWRREKFFEELWVPLVTGIPVYNVEEWNNSLES